MTYPNFMCSKEFHGGRGNVIVGQTHLEREYHLTRENKPEFVPALYSTLPLFIHFHLFSKLAVISVGSCFFVGPLVFVICSGYNMSLSIALLMS